MANARGGDKCERLLANALLMAVYLAASVTPLPAAEDALPSWPQFRGVGANGRADVRGPMEWDGESGRNVLWKVEVPGLGHSSPVLWGDHIFVATAVPDSGEASLKVGLYGDIAAVTDDPEQRFMVVAFDRGSGEQRWEKTVFHGVPAVQRHTKATHANSTPATDGERVVAFFGSEGLHALDLDGNPLWQRSFGVLDSGFFMVPSAQWGFASSPVLFDGRVIVQVDVQGESFLASLDAENGETQWRTPRDEVPTWSTPAVLPRPGDGGGWQVVVNGWKHIGGYDLATGAELWRLEGGGDIPVPTPVYDGAHILITSAHGSERPIYAIDPSATGTLTTASPAMRWHVEKAGNYMQTPLVVGELAYFCFDTGVLSVYRTADGERLFQERLGGGASGFTASGVAAGDRLYFTSENGETFVLQAGEKPQVVARNELGETVMATPAVVDGVLYIRGRRHLFAVGEVAPAGDTAP